MKLRLTMIIVMSMILFVNLSYSLPSAQAAEKVDDWLKENQNESEDETKEIENEDNEDKKTPTDEQNAELEKPDKSNASLFVVIVKMIFALLLVLGLIYVLLQFLKKKNKLFLKSDALENIGGITVGTNKSMQIIRIGTRFFVIGVGENVEILHEITDQEIVEDLLDRDETNEKSTNFLTSLMSTKATGQKQERHFKQLFSKELGELKQNRKKIMNENKEDTHE